MISLWKKKTWIPTGFSRDEVVKPRSLDPDHAKRSWDPPWFLINSQDFQGWFNDSLVFFGHRPSVPICPNLSIHPSINASIHLSICSIFYIQSIHHQHPYGLLLKTWRCCCLLLQYIDTQFHVLEHLTAKTICNLLVFLKDMWNFLEKVFIARHRGEWKLPEQQRGF